jgi:hypothetical protein
MERKHSDHLHHKKPHHHHHARMKNAAGVFTPTQEDRGVLELASISAGKSDSQLLSDVSLFEAVDHHPVTPEQRQGFVNDMHRLKDLPKPGKKATPQEMKNMKFARNFFS